MDFVTELEKQYALFAHTKYAVAVNSGTAALHLALVGLGIGPGDEVIVPDFTMAACAFAVSYTGATPVFVDCGPDLNIDVTKIEEKITHRTKAIMAVHIYGRLCDMEAIHDLVEHRSIAVIEDACEAQGATDGKSDITVFSFYKNKIINAEEGGMICTDDYSLYIDLKDLKSLSFGAKHDYFHERIGFNYRMPESQAKLALQSLAEYDENSKKRREVESWYADRIKSKLPERDAVWVFDFLTAFKEKYMERAQKQGIQARHFFKPMSSMPMYGGEIGRKAKLYSENGMYLPVYPSMTKEEVNSICDFLDIK